MMIMNRLGTTISTDIKFINGSDDNNLLNIINESINDNEDETECNLDSYTVVDTSNFQDVIGDSSISILTIL